MDSTIFSQAIDQAFPQLDESAKNQLISKISIHMLEFLKEKVYLNDNVASLELDNLINTEQDVEKSSQEYGKRIIEKLKSLPADQQEPILEEFNKEMTDKMHQVYNTINQ